MNRKDFMHICGIYLLNKIYIVFLVWLTRDILQPFLPTVTDNYHPHILFDSLLHWDAGWYLRIAAQGYDFNHAPFFPMFPFLICLIAKIVGSSVVAGFLLSNIALFVASIFLYIIAKEEFDRKTATLAVFVMLFFPTAIFFTSVYSESLLLAFAISSFYFARRQRWLWAILLACCATLTRNVGIVLFLAFLYMQYQQNGHKVPWKKALPLLLIPSSLSIFMFVLWTKTGDPLAFMHSLDTDFWGHRHFLFPGAGQLSNIKGFIYGNNFYNLFELSMAWFFIFLIIYSLKIIKDKPLLIFLTISFLIPFSSVVNDMTLGMPRYILILFPGYIALARLLLNHGLTQAYASISIIIFSAVSILFVAGHWIS